MSPPAGPWASRSPGITGGRTASATPLPVRVIRRHLRLAAHHPCKNARARLGRPQAAQTSGADPAGQAARRPGSGAAEVSAPTADVLWCGDVTQIDTGEGKLYLARVEDLFSCRLLGHAMFEHHDAALAVASLQMAVATCGGDVDGVIFHSDDGLAPITFERHVIEKRHASSALLRTTVA
ncbi:DDE-type integrase/transposase/recombinase [Nonomuraea aurantiaca]|uniref:DDE-type integrase/transposase/recombinase n=1 Tax=Nonomuraea aurantiaca TaxID=2878562 RepID=UPI001CD9E978|nr:DDE-type integrase/transposase/recombinase [Nonomuraea aurantiaca]MCA2229979.1 DDE-type integrase/transposase/recombinase [Nonomuraea aurantiaca]